MKEKNIRKSFVIPMIGAICIGGIVCLRTYCIRVNKENNFERIVTESGEYDLENFISYDNLKEYSLVEINTITGENKLFVAKINGILFLGYNDIFTDKDICEGDYTDFVNIYKIEDYLVAYDMIKAKYNKEDIETLLEKIKEDYEFTEDKELVKE